jgi:hypothetical protein
MKEVTISDDDECLDIALSMIEDIESLRGATKRESLVGGRAKPDLKVLFMKRMRMDSP